MGCGGDDDTDADEPQVTISGNHSVQLGSTLELSASTRNGSDTTYVWSSSDDGIATVDSATGVVTAVAAGEVDITAMGGTTGAAGQHPVVVVGGGEALVQIDGDFTVVVGETVQLTATTINGADSAYTWASSDELLATVDADGNVTGHHSGEVTITATGADSGLSGDKGLAVSNEIPNFDLWRGSGHADNSAEPFNHWNEEDPLEIPTSCARCHSTPGYRDYIGADGTDPFVVDNPAPIGTVIECQACHNDAADQLSTVEFPSGVVIADLGPEARCMTCHQGRSSTDDVDADIAEAMPVDDDTPDTDLSFINIHYYAAGATLNAGRVRGGYQYADKVYDFRFRHVPERDVCIECHDPHSLQVRLTACQGCHDGITDVESLKTIRMMASLGQDYDGDGNTTEGIFFEMTGLRDKLYEAITQYPIDRGNARICYDTSAYPYFFIDGNANGACDPDEVNFGNRYNEWSPRLLRAAYNYQVSLKDPGAFAHNAKYIIQLLFDSTTDLNTALTNPVDMAAAVRTDFGHFDGSGEPARHWDEDDEVSASCSRCHGGSEGFRFFVEFNVGLAVQEQDNGLDCATCHDSFDTTYATVPVDGVVFPSGQKIDIADTLNTTNMCGTCHAGRESKATVDARIAAGSLGFRNIHYLPAAGTLAGTDAQVGYEYDGKSYAGRMTHTGPEDCVGCHDPVLTNHSFEVAQAISLCSGCHSGVTDPHQIRLVSTADFDGDGNNTEPLADEIATLADELLLEIQSVATGAGTPICYSPGSYPYFFNDTNGDGACDATEANFGNRFNSFTPALMKATFNYQYSQKEPGAWAHNFDYMAQLLIDSIEDLGGAGAIVGFTRP